MVNYWDRLKPEMDRKGLSIQGLADALGVSYQAVKKVAAGGAFGSENNLKAAVLFGVRPEYLAIGKGPRTVEYPQRSQFNQENVDNLEAAKAHAGEVPVISWVQAGAWHEVAATFQPSEAERLLPIFRGHSSQTYALKVRGDSMTSPHGKSYPQGSYIIVDPAKLQPVNGDRIVAKLEGSDEVTFKVYKDEDGRKWLAPLNTTYPTIMDPFKVLGTVIGKWEDE